MSPNVDSNTLVKTCEVWSLVFKAFRRREVFFSWCKSQGREIILKLIKSGQRNIKNFSENYKYVSLLKLKTVTSAVSAWKSFLTLWVSPFSSELHGEHPVLVKPSVLGKKIQSSVLLFVKENSYVFGSLQYQSIVISLTRNSVNIQVWRQLASPNIKKVKEEENSKLLRLTYSGISHIVIIKSTITLG